MNVEHLTDEAVSQHLETITAKLNECGPADKRHFLSVIVDELDDLDQDDAFGTEGWKRTFGIEY